jgi:hypothetical protein
MELQVKPKNMCGIVIKKDAIDVIIMSPQIENHKDDLLSKIIQFDCEKENIKVPYFQKPVTSFFASQF